MNKDKISLSDEDLWESISGGDRNAFTRLYDRYWLRMYKAAIHYLNDREAAEEVVQEVFLHIWTGHQTLEIKNLKAYLNSSTRYGVYKRIKVTKRSLLSYREELTENGAVYNEGANRLLEIDHINLLDSCLNQLPKRCKEVFYLSKSQHLTNTEISERLGISKHTVENQLAIALKHLKVNLNRIAMFIFI